jgi:hypothetical protein
MELYSCEILHGTNMWGPTVPELLMRGIILQGTLIHGTTAGDDYSVVKHRGGKIKAPLLRPKTVRASQQRNSSQDTFPLKRKKAATKPEFFARFPLPGTLRFHSWI